ncbi:putative receptor protein kinase ZmPK1 [Punica granatum]|uniref:Receptor-like serine/threonine-protein kinase n=1 Tax=Punica granatum TaxID=22663 RepID=A0A6P8CJ08_PUNGR|nr:putative receptor protein kinase ZmPK1 [Punica granatum]
MRNTIFSFFSSSLFIPVLLFLAISFSLTSSSLVHRDGFLSRGSALSVDDPDDVLRSPNGVFFAGFHRVGRNAYSFAVWFSNQSCMHDCIVWMANRDEPVNGKHSKLILDKHGNLFLIDAGHKVVWSTDIASSSSATYVGLHLLDSGNLILRSSGPRPRDDTVMWQSFDHPTNTLLPEQKFTQFTELVSSRSGGNISSGHYKLFFDYDNVLQLLYSGPEISSLYWPRPDRLPWDAGRTTYNDSRVALLDSLGNFTSSDDWNFLASDYGEKNRRRLTLDFDGNVLLYSLLKSGEWAVSWQAIDTPCQIHGICGPNAVCQYNARSGRSCSCAPGYERKNLSDWSQGCKPKFESFCKLPDPETEFIRFPHMDFYGYDEAYYPNYTLNQCKKKCLELCNCKGFQYKFQGKFHFKFQEENGQHNCYPKVLLLNGYASVADIGNIYFRLPKAILSSDQIQQESSTLNCSHSSKDVELHRVYSRSHKSDTLLKILLILAVVIAGFEALMVLLVLCFVTGTRKTKGEARQGYHLAAMGFRRYTYAELRKATRNFREEIGRGAVGSVYRAILSGDWIAAVKRLNEMSLHGEDEFLAEVSTIGRLNHMNLIELWGYCAEGKHRLLVYEYMEHGSLAENLSKGTLDWGKRLDVAVGAARGLAYLHEECLEWVLHCDVKPQNILLDLNYQPKVADFGLSKLLNRGDVKHSSFSKIRGTRGYMAPEWVYNLSITSKVDVYNYGIVLLEMVTGRSPGVGVLDTSARGETENRGLTSWVKQKMSGEVPTAIRIEEIVDHSIEGGYDVKKVEVLVAVALQCVADDKDDRPTMSQVVEILHRCTDEAEI